LVSEMRRMKELFFRFRTGALLAILGLFVLVGIRPMAEGFVSNPTLYWHTETFCPNAGDNCDSTATSFTVPPYVQQMWGKYCGSGGAGGGGYGVSTTNGGGAGGGAAGAGVGFSGAGYGFNVKPATVLTLNFTSAPSGAVSGSAATNGAPTWISYTLGSLAYKTPYAWGGQGGLAGLSANGGQGGNAGCAISGTTACGLAPTYNFSAGGAGGTSGAAAGNSAQITGVGDGVYSPGSSGAGGGASSTNLNGGSTRLIDALNGANGSVAGGTGSGTAGAGGAGGSSLLALGGAGGAASANGSAAAGLCAGGGGGSTGFSGGAGGDPWLELIWFGA
jgi:hypothetical protein